MVSLRPTWMLSIQQSCTTLCIYISPPPHLSAQPASLSVHCLGTASVAVNGGRGLLPCFHQSWDSRWPCPITTWATSSLIGSHISDQSTLRRLCSWWAHYWPCAA